MCRVMISQEFQSNNIKLYQYFCDTFNVSILDIGMVFENYISYTVSKINSEIDKSSIDELLEEIEVPDYDDLGIPEIISFFPIFNFYTNDDYDVAKNILIQMQNVSGFVDSYYSIENGKYVSNYEIEEIFEVIYGNLLCDLVYEMLDKIPTLIHLAVYNKEFIVHDVIIDTSKTKLFNNTLYMIYTVNN